MRYALASRSATAGIGIPVAVNDAATVASLDAAIIDVLANDAADVDPTTVEILASGSNGEALETPDGTVLYQCVGDPIYLARLACDANVPLTTNYTAVLTAGAGSSVTATAKGFRLTAGPLGAGNTPGAANAWAHVVSKLSGLGKNVMLVFDMTIHDASPGSSAGEAILISMSKGAGTAGFPADPNTWTVRDGTTRYTTVTNTRGYRVTLAPGHIAATNRDQVRTRIFPTDEQLLDSNAPNTQPGSFPFPQNVTYRCVVLKFGTQFRFHYWPLTELPEPPVDSDFVQVATLHRFDEGRTRVNGTLHATLGAPNTWTYNGTTTLDLRGGINHSPAINPDRQSRLRFDSCGSGFIATGMSVIDDTPIDTITWRQRKTQPSKSWPEGTGVNTDNDFIYFNSGGAQTIIEGAFCHHVMDIFNPNSAAGGQTGTMTVRTFYGRYLCDDVFPLVNSNRAECTDALMENIHTLVSMEGSAGRLDMDHSIVHLGRVRYSESPDCQIQVAGSMYAGRYPNNTQSPLQGPRNGNSCPVPYNSTVSGFSCIKFHKEIPNSAIINYTNCIFRQDSRSQAAGADDWPVNAITCVNCVFIWLGVDASGNPIPFPGTLPSSGMTFYDANDTIDGMPVLSWYNEQRRMWLDAHQVARNSDGTVRTIDQLRPQDFPFLNG